MLDFIIEVLKEGIGGSLSQLLAIAKIVFPLMIFIEITKDLKLLDKISDIFQPVTSFFKLSGKASFPLLVGIVFGLTYGAGVIIQYVKEGHLNARELIIINTFLALCHALVEDTLLFMVVGASGTMLIITRLIIAIIVTAIVARVITDDNIANTLLINPHNLKTENQGLPR